MSYSYTTSQTFTRVNARYLASKVAADLHLMHLYYDHPADSAIPAYLEELTELLAGGYVAAYEFGFNRNGQRVLSLRYTVTQAGDLVADDSAGRVFGTANVAGATYYNYLTHSDKWWRLTPEERARIEGGLPIDRQSGNLPSDGAGYWETGTTYSSNGVALPRRTFRPY